MSLERDDKEERVQEEQHPPSITKLIQKLAENAEQVIETSDDVILQSRLHALVGKTLDNRYLVLERIGQGGMGVVYKAKHTILDRFIALKVLNPSLGNDENSLKRFLREAKLLSKLKHPNAISLYEFGIDNEMPYLVMEYVEGQSLAQVLKDQGPFDLERSVRILEQVCDAVESAHQLGIVHRDLKPDNIMITVRPNGDEFVQVLDFGVAKLVSTGDRTHTKVSTTGVPCGTPHYMSPELIMSETVDGRSDIYALGIILYEMLSGETPFERDSLVQILFKQVHDTPPLIGDEHPELQIPSLVEEVIHTALEKDPKARYQTAGEFCKALRASVELQLTPQQQRSRRNRLRSRARYLIQLSRGTALMTERQRRVALYTIMIISLIGAIWGSSRFKQSLRLRLAVPVLKLEQLSGLRLTPFRSLFRIPEMPTEERLFFHTREPTLTAERSLQLLLAFGINPNARDEQRRTPLHHVSEIGRLGMAERLIYYAADINAEDALGKIPLHYAASANHAAMLYDLVRYGSRIDAQDASGKTALVYAVSGGYAGAVHALVELGASVHLPDANDETPLMYAARSGKNVQILLDRGASPTARSKAGSTALMEAVKSGQTDVVKLLIRRGSELSAQDANGYSALHQAVLSRQPEIAIVLLEAGIQPSLEDKKGRTARSLAQQMNTLALADAIRKYSSK